MPGWPRSLAAPAALTMLAGPAALARLASLPRWPDHPLLTVLADLTALARLLSPPCCPDGPAALTGQAGPAALARCPCRLVAPTALYCLTVQLPSAPRPHRLSLRRCCSRQGRQAAAYVVHLGLYLVPVFRVLSQHPFRLPGGPLLLGPRFREDLRRTRACVLLERSRQRLRLRELPLRVRQCRLRPRHPFGAPRVRLGRPPLLRPLHLGPSLRMLLGLLGEHADSALAYVTQHGKRLP